MNKIQRICLCLGAEPQTQDWHIQHGFHSLKNVFKNSKTKLRENEGANASIFSPIPPPKIALDTVDPLLIRRTLHSGERIQSHSPVILTGNLNAGAEIISEKDIFVLGKLRGVVHAGASGNKDSYVFALSMQPVQIRIADLFALPLKVDRLNASSGPETAFVEEDRIIIVPGFKREW